ncbi:MAG: 16S rRNA (cytosine(1402)-N(4))-methyltransferase, partial [Rhizobiaceae bacterium]
MTDGNICGNIAGGPVRHVPVMLNEVLACLSPAEGKKFIDGTFGAGGYSIAILDKGSSVLAIDRDPNAIRDGVQIVSRYGGRLILKQGEFSDMDEMARERGFDPVDGV